MFRRGLHPLDPGPIDTVFWPQQSELPSAKQLSDWLRDLPIYDRPVRFGGKQIVDREFRHTTSWLHNYLQVERDINVSDFCSDQKFYEFSVGRLAHSGALYCSFRLQTKGVGGYSGYGPKVLRIDSDRYLCLEG